MCDVVRLVDALAWPVVALVAIGAVASPRGRDLLTRLVGRMSRLKAGGIEIELTPEVSREVKDDLTEVFRKFRDSATKAFDAQVHVERINAWLERVAQDDIRAALADSTYDYRTTVYVPDLLFEDVLYRLVGYYPSGGGRGTTYSARFGIIGRAWRLQRSETARVPADHDQLIEQWGMTVAEATRQQGAKTFVCILLCGEEDQPVGLLFVDSEAVGAFVPDVVKRLEASPSLKSLAKAVDRATRHVRQAGQPPLKIFDE